MATRRQVVGGMAAAGFAALAGRSLAASAWKSPRRFFSDRSFWNQPIPKGAKADRANDRYLDFLRQEPTGAFGINLEEWTIPVYEADASTPTYSIGEHTLTPQERKQWNTERETFGHGRGFGESVPIPNAAVPDRQEDAHFAVIDWTRQLAWDMWGFRRRSDGSFESNTGMVYPIDGDGVFRTSDFAVRDGESIHLHGPSRAAGVPAVAGLILLEEVLAGAIHHRLACAIRYSAFQEFVFPAAWTDGFTKSGIPEGAVIQLDPALDLGRFDLLPGERVVARALQEYGCVLVDVAQGSTLYGEGLWGHPGKSWTGVLRKIGGISTIPVDNYRILELRDVIRRGDARSLAMPYWP